MATKLLDNRKKIKLKSTLQTFHAEQVVDGVWLVWTETNTAPKVRYSTEELEYKIEQLKKQGWK